MNNYFNTFSNVEHTCFLCGCAMPASNTPASKKDCNKEHVFPKWILSRYGVQHINADYLMSANTTESRNFKYHQVRVHRVCNTIFGDKLEQPMSANEAISQIWLWGLKIYCGTLFSAAYTFNGVSEVTPEIYSGKQDERFNELWENAPHILQDGVSPYHMVGTVIELDYVFSGDEFFHHINYEMQTLWITFNHKSYLILFNNNLTEKEISEVKDEWALMQKQPPELPDNSVATLRYMAIIAETAIYHRFRYPTHVSHNCGFLVPADVPFTEEIEKEILAGYGLKKEIHPTHGKVFTGISVHNN